MSKIHPTAVVSPKAELGSDVEIGPYSVVEPDVRIGDGCIIDTHVKIASHTTLGPNCRVYMGALVGEEPQDHRFRKGLMSSTEIGHDTVIREYVTIHRPPFEGIKTVVGSHVLLMAFVHVAHDVVIEDRVTVANHTAITGHVELGFGSVLSGYVKIHQFCRIGRFAMIGAEAIISQDVPPYCLLSDNKIYGPNIIGLRRAGFTPAQRSDIRKAIKLYFFSGLNSKHALEEIDQMGAGPEVALFTDFIRSTKRGIMPGNPKFSVFGMDEDEEAASLPPM